MASEAVSARPSRLVTAARLHYASLVIGLIAILIVGRNQWFFGDDWAILAPHLDDDVMVPHVGHWNLIPAVVFPALRDLVGLGSYLPFLALALAAHLAVVHLSWRVLQRVGVDEWLATALAIVLLLLGGGAENILWAFQFGFMGAIALGLGVVLAIDRPKPLIPVIIVLSVLAPMFSGTAIPVLAAAAVLGWIRHGFWRTVALFAPAAAVYLTWYLVVARGYPSAGQGVDSIADAGPALLYAAVMYAGGLGRALPFIGLGVIPAVAVVAWVVVTVRRRAIRTAVAPAFALAVGSVVFVGLTAFSRLENGLSSAAAERYAYATVVLLLPVVGLLLAAIIRRSARARVITIVAVLLVAASNTVYLVLQAQEQSVRELGSRERVYDFLEEIREHPKDTQLLDRMADPPWAIDLLGADLLTLYDDGQLPARS